MKMTFKGYAVALLVLASARTGLAQSLPNEDVISAVPPQASSCLQDYHTAQRLVRHGLTPEQVQTLQAYADANEPAAGWEYLGNLGDKYAAVSYKVVSTNPEFTKEKFHKMVRRHWQLTVGRATTDLMFETIAATHFRHYVEILKTGYWPDSDQILLSYLTSAREAGLPDKVVFDATWVRSGLDKIIGWEKVVGLQRDRIVHPSLVCADINGTAGFFKILLNLFKLPF